MCQNGAFHGLAVHNAHVLARKEIQAVKVAFQFFQIQILGRLLYIHKGFKHNAAAVLQILAHRVQVGAENAAGGHQALLILALTLAVQLLEPLAHHGEIRLKAGQRFHLFALAIQNRAGHGIFVGGVFHAALAKQLHAVCSALHEFVNVNTGHGDGQKAHSSQHTIAAAHIVRHHKGGPAAAVSQLLQRALGTVGRGINAAVGFLFAHSVHQQLAQHAEGQCRFGGGAALGDHIDGKTLALGECNDIIQCAGRNAVAAEIDLGAVCQLVVIHALAGFDHGTSAQIAAADACHQQHIGIIADLFGCRLDAGKFLFIIGFGQVHPAQKIVAGAGFAFQQFMRQLYLRVKSRIFIVGDKLFKVLPIKIDCHQGTSSVHFCIK